MTQSAGYTNVPSPVPAGISPGSSAVGPGRTPLGSLDYRVGGVGTTFNLAQMVTDAEAQGRPIMIQRGATTPSSFNIPLDRGAPGPGYYIQGQDETCTLLLPPGMGPTDFLFLPNSIKDASLYPHHEVTISELTVNGFSSPNGSFMYAYGRSVKANGVRFGALLNGIVTAGYSDRLDLRNIYAAGMTAGGFVITQAGLGDGGIIDGLFAYACAGLSIKHQNGMTIRALMGGWHTFFDSTVHFSGYHIEGDGSTDADPLLNLQGGDYVFESGILYCTPSRPAVQLDNSGQAGRSTRAYFKRGHKFMQRVDQPGSAYGAGQGVAINIPAGGWNPQSMLAMDAPKCFVFGQTAAPPAAANTSEAVLPTITATDAAVSTALTALPQRLLAVWELRYRNGSYEVVEPDLLSGIRTMRKVSAALTLALTPGTPVGYLGDFAAATYFYKAWTINCDGFATATVGEQSAAITAGQVMSMALGLQMGPSRVRLVRGTATGVYDHHVDIYIPGESPLIVDQGSFIAGQQWLTTGLPTPVANNETQDGYSPRGNGRREIWASAPPSFGPFNAGDVCHNTAPAVGSPYAWVCTVAGSGGGAGGTWVALANL